MRLRELRNEKSWTLDEMAINLGVSPQTISNWEHGRTEPDIKSLIHLADLFNVTIDYLVEKEPTRQDINEFKLRIERMDSTSLKEIIIQYIDTLNGK